VVEVDKLGYAITIPAALKASSTPATVERMNRYDPSKESQRTTKIKRTNLLSLPDRHKPPVTAVSADFPPTNRDLA
jgi:hypothetical protein